MRRLAIIYTLAIDVWQRVIITQVASSLASAPSGAGGIIAQLECQGSHAVFVKQCAHQMTMLFDGHRCAINGETSIKR